ncbi:cytochrome c oxidase subunit 5A, mitochondrial-like [Agrilus planipennis]|uniref:Cytochrome c oxidase subunit 5A, mitochondrial n=1 Tax=Agrilus planipennis TaxID=224129 RepID=A0A1W4WTE5_AGRPL|nr:cytochrome c oxidase subunit 5A, mitochondrial-like [Agrilus planipennis]
MSSLIRNALSKSLRNVVKLAGASVGSKRTVYHTALHDETPEELDTRYECFFCRPDIDGWDIRQAMSDLIGMDMVPEPRIIIAAMYACRRINEYAVAVRFLEACKYKCGHHEKEIWPYILQEVGPTLCELGIDSPESLGIDKPELWSPSVFDIH